MSVLEDLNQQLVNSVCNAMGPAGVQEETRIGRQTIRFRAKFPSERSAMNKEKILSIYLYAFGLANMFVVSFTIPLLFGDQLLWAPRNVPTEMMMAGIYFVMGLSMILVARNPLPHQAFVDFVALSSIVHAVIMLVYAEHILHLFVDVAFMGVMGVVPLLVYPWGLKKFLRYK